MGATALKRVGSVLILFPIFNALILACNSSFAIIVVSNKNYLTLVLRYKLGTVQI